MKRTLLCMIVSLFILFDGKQAAHAQSVTLNHGHYGTYGLSTNSALSLLSPGGGVAFVGRQQWVGLDGAPQVYMASGYMGFPGIAATGGVVVRQDRLGAERFTEASAFFSKSVRLSEKDYIGLSLNAGLVHMDGRFSSLDPQDPAFREDIRESDALIGFGAVYYRPEAFFVGVSLPRFTMGGVGVLGDTRYNFQNMYHFTTGMLFAVGGDIHLRPSVQLFYSDGNGAHLEGSAMVFMKRMFGLGVGARSQGDLSGLVRINHSGFGIGYSYQFHAGNKVMDRYINNSTHEIALSYSFKGLQSLL